MLGLATRKTAVTTGASLPVLLGLAAAVIFLVVGSISSNIFAQQTVAGLAQGAIFGSLALALVLIYRATEVINFAQGELAMATTYIAYQLTLWGLSYWLSFFLTLVIAFVLGAVLQIVFIRPIQHSVIAVVIVTVGMFILIDGLVTWKLGADL
jgi:branched-chain amino acid transport system permease protein